MARPADPHDDLIRVAELVDQAAVLVSRGIDASEILTGLAIRIREDVDRIRPPLTVMQAQAQAKPVKGKISTLADFEALTRRGWSGCMHDSDCACSSAVLDQDSDVINAYLAERDG